LQSCRLRRPAVSPNHLRQGYGGAPKLYVKAEGLRYFGLPTSIVDVKPLVPE